MAPLRPGTGEWGSGRGDEPSVGDRGQLLLVAVLVLAAAFIILALVVNSAIFTENIATRQSPPGAQDALENRAESIDSAARVIEDLNHNSSIEPTMSDLNDELGLDYLFGRLNQSALRGQILATQYNGGFEDGFIIAQRDSSRDFVDSTGTTGDFTVVQNVNGIRNLQFELHDADNNANFDLLVTGTLGNSWEMEINENSGNIIVRVLPGNGNTYECIRDDSELSDGLTIDVTGGTVGGEACYAFDRDQSNGDALWFSSVLEPPYGVIEFSGGDEVTGNYSMVVNTTALTPVWGPVNDVNEDPNPANPYFQEAVYGADIDYIFGTHSVRYTAPATVRPGEAPP